MTLHWIWHTIWGAFEVSFWRENEHSYSVATLNPLSWSVGDTFYKSQCREITDRTKRMRDKTHRTDRTDGADRKDMSDI